MELVLLIVLLVLALAAYAGVRLARRVYGRRQPPNDRERTFVRALLTRPPAKPPAPYTLRRRNSGSPPPPAPPPAEDA